MNPSQNPSALRSKSEITEALFELMKATPYQEITVKQLILESKVAKKTFYRNFTSKDDVLDAYINEIMEQYTQLLQQITDYQLSSFLDIIFHFCQQNKDFLFLLRDHRLMTLLLEKWNTFIPMIHERLVCHNHLLFQSLDSKQVAYIIAFNVGAMWNIITKWVEYDMVESPEEIKQMLLIYFQNFGLTKTANF